MNILNASYCKLSNAIFCYGLTPIQLAVYSYLVPAQARKKMLAIHESHLSSLWLLKNAARAAADELVRRGFIRKTPTYQEGWGSKNRHEPAAPTHGPA